MDPKLKTLPEFFRHERAPASPSMGLQSAFPPFKVEHTYKGVYERAGFDIYKNPPKSKTSPSSKSNKSNPNSPVTSQSFFKDSSARSSSSTAHGQQRRMLDSQRAEKSPANYANYPTPPQSAPGARFSSQVSSPRSISHGSFQNPHPNYQQQAAPRSVSSPYSAKNTSSVSNHSISSPLTATPPSASYLPFNTSQIVPKNNKNYKNLEIQTVSQNANTSYTPNSTSSSSSSERRRTNSTEMTNNSSMNSLILKKGDENDSPVVASSNAPYPTNNMNNGLGIDMRTTSSLPQPSTSINFSRPYPTDSEMSYSDPSLGASNYTTMPLNSPTADSSNNPYSRTRNTPYHLKQQELSRQHTLVKQETPYPVLDNGREVAPSQPAVVKPSFLNSNPMETRRDSVMSMMSSVLTQSSDEEEDDEDAQIDRELEEQLNEFHQEDGLPTFKITSDEPPRFHIEENSPAPSENSFRFSPPVSKEIELLDNEIDKQLLESQLDISPDNGADDTLSSIEGNDDYSPELPLQVSKDQGRFESLSQADSSALSGFQDTTDELPSTFNAYAPSATTAVPSAITAVPIQSQQQVPKYFEHLELNPLKDIPNITSSSSNMASHAEPHAYKRLSGAYSAIESVNSISNSQFDSDHQSQISVKKYPSGEGPCRVCNEEINTKPIYSKTGELSGQWHRPCFKCYKCQIKFNKHIPCYVFNDEPYCQQHYHELNDSLCAICHLGVEGECIENEISEKFHLECLTCSKCTRSIDSDYYIVNDQILCESDALNLMNTSNGLQVNDKIEKRRTRLMFMN